MTETLTPGTSKATGVRGRPKALPYWLKVTLRKLVELRCDCVHHLCVLCIIYRNFCLIRAASREFCY